RRERGRDSDFEGCADSGRAAKSDFSTKLLNRFANHVEADAAAGLLGHRLRCADPSPQEHAYDILGPKFRRRGIQQTTLQRDPSHDLEIDAMAVVAARKDNSAVAPRDSERHNSH